MKNKHSSIVNLSILALVTTFFWLIFNVYRLITKQPPEPVPVEIISPINPNLDTNTLNELKTRYFIDEANLPENTLSPTLKPTPKSSPSPQPTITPSPNTSPTPALSQ